MSMRTYFELHDINRIEATLSVTMPIGEWRALRAQLADQHPSWRFASAISNVIEQAERVFCSNEDTKAKEAPP